MTKGMFLTLYGINNIGKSTHAQRLVERLNQEGHKAVYLKYPIYDLEPTGSQINNILRLQGEQEVSEEQLQSLFMQNRKDFEPQLKKMLDEGTIVVAEDYTQTGIAWGTAKGLDEAWVETLNDGLMREDFSLLIVGERARNAIEKDHIHETNDELVQKVAQVLQRRAAQHGWYVIDLQPTKDETAVLVWEAVQKFLNDFSAREA